MRRDIHCPFCRHTEGVFVPLEGTEGPEDYDGERGYEGAIHCLACGGISPLLDSPEQNPWAAEPEPVVLDYARLVEIDGQEMLCEFTAMRDCACGGEPSLDVDVTSEFYVFCHECCTATGKYGFAGAALAAWNSVVRSGGKAEEFDLPGVCDTGGEEVWP